MNELKWDRDVCTKSRRRFSDRKDLCYIDYSFHLNDDSDALSRFAVCEW